MCGIAGIYHNQVDTSAMQQMLKAMIHRGPDDSGTFQSGPVSFGHNRLSILDLSAAGHQPMTSASGRYTIVLNGEVYNFNELREHLPQFPFRSHSDTEVVLELWAQMQEKCLPLLRGMFAFAIWDHQEKTLSLARDHMGIKPLYYWHDQGKLVFASEIKGMLASGMILRKMNPDALVQYLNSGYVMQPGTMIKDVHMLPPASWMHYDGHKLTIKKYWSIEEQPAQKINSEEEAIAFTRQLIENSVAEETISDRPLGVFLSGGLDSTVLVAALRNKGIQQIRTFSVGFDGDDLSEEEDAKIAADFYGTQHTQIQVTDADVLPYIERYISAIDQPSVDGLNTWLVSKVTARHVTVALSGLGGDEVFSGYGVDRKILSRKKFVLPASILYHTRALWQHLLPESIANKLLAVTYWRSVSQSYSQWGRLFDTGNIRDLTGQASAARNVSATFRSVDPGSGYNWLQRISHMHLRGFMMSRLLRDSDAVSMDHSLEVRFPVIDHRIVSQAWHWPTSWKIKNLAETAELDEYEKESSYSKNGVKHLLYQAFKNDLPPAFGTRPKRGFKMPVDKWMRKGLEKDIELMLTASDSFLDPDTLKKYHAQWKAGERAWPGIWALYVLEKWTRQNRISA